MLAMYNESGTNWVRAGINSKTSKITTSRTLNDGKVRYLDVLINDEIATPILGEAVNMSEFRTLYDGNTSIKFKSKDLKPYITKSDKYNTDVLFVNIALKGRIIKNISENNSVIAYLIAHGELFLILALNDKNEPVNVNVTLHDPNAAADTVYSFEKINGRYFVNSDTVQTDAVINKPTYKINRFRPARPTNVIFTADVDSHNVKDNLKYPDSHQIFVYRFGDFGSSFTDIETLKKNGYKAATLYVDQETFVGSDDNNYGEMFNTLKKNFKFVNILLSNGRVLRK